VIANSRTWRIRSCRRLRADTRPLPGAIDDTRPCSPAAPDQDIFEPLLRLFPLRIPQGVFSLSSQHGACSFSRINCAFIYQADTSLPPFPPVSGSMCTWDLRMRSKDGIYTWTGRLRPTLLTLSSTLPVRRLRPFASWEIGLKILHDAPSTDPFLTTAEN